jgi:hypothetical protein
MDHKSFACPRAKQPKTTDRAGGRSGATGREAPAVRGVQLGTRKRRRADADDARLSDAAEKAAELMEQMQHAIRGLQRASAAAAPGDPEHGVDEQVAQLGDTNGTLNCRICGYIHGDEGCDFNDGDFGMDELDDDGDYSY